MRRPMRMRTRVIASLLGIVLVVACCFALTAALLNLPIFCSRVTTQAQPTTAAVAVCPPFPTPTPISEPGGYHYFVPAHRGGTLTYGDWQFPTSTNPWFASTPVDREVEDALWGSPVVITSDGNFLPDELVEVPTVANGDVSADGLKITLHLKLGLEWSDGQPLTADDFVYWLDALLDPRTGAASTYGFDQLASYKAMNPATLVLTYKQPFADYLFYLPGAAPKHAWDSIPHQQLFTTPAVNLAPTVTSGPFHVAQMVSDQSIMMAPNKLYASTSLHASVLDTLIFKTYLSQNALIAAYQAGEINHIEDFSLADMQKLNNMPGLQIGPGLAYEHLDFNLQQPALQDVKVRKAIEQAVDRCGLIAMLFHEPCNTLSVNEPEPPPNPAADPTIKEYPFDLNAARADMQAAGWDCSGMTCAKAGAAFPTLTLLTESDAAQLQAATLIKQQLETLGILVTISSPGASGGSSGSATQAALEMGHYDLALIAFDFGLDSDANLYPHFHSSQIPGAANPTGGNWERVNDSMVDHWLDQGRATLDAGARSNIYKQVQRYLIQQVYSMPLYLLPNITLTDSRVGNYYANPLFLLTGGNEWNIGEWYRQ